MSSDELAEEEEKLLFEECARRIESDEPLEEMNLQEVVEDVAVEVAEIEQVVRNGRIVKNSPDVDASNEELFF